MLELKEKIVKLINESNLPIDAIVMLTKDIYRDALDGYNEYQAMKRAEAAKVPAQPEQEEKEDDN